MSVACPFCGSRDTELASLFGQQLLTVQYYCSACRTPFEKVKDDAVLAEADARWHPHGRVPGPSRSPQHPPAATSEPGAILVSTVRSPFGMNSDHHKEDSHGD